MDSKLLSQYISQYKKEIFPGILVDVFRTSHCEYIQLPSGTRIPLTSDYSITQYKDGICVTDRAYNTTRYYNSQLILHRDDGPATVHVDAAGGYHRSWYNNGRLHRVGGPAITIYRPFCKRHEWWAYGKKHREDGPAEIQYDRNTLLPSLCRWYRKDHLHRKNGPAVICLSTRTYVYRYRGGLHRTDGPALYLGNGTGVWGLYGVAMSFQQWVCSNKELPQSELMALILSVGPGNTGYNFDQILDENKQYISRNFHESTY